MMRLNRTLTRTALTASTLALAGAAVAALAAPAASASTPDQFLYPQSGHIRVDPTMAQVLSAVPAAGSAGAAKDGLVMLSGPSTTVAALSTAQNVIDGPVRQAATINAGVDVNWQISPDGAIFNTTEVH